MNGRFTVNGVEVGLEFRPEETLLRVLRRSGHTEVKAGCEEGECGACIVLLDGEPVNSCRMFAATVRGRRITTVSGIGTIRNPHPIQTALAEEAAVQCGFCTPGIVLAAYALLSKNRRPSGAEIWRALDGNLCRCAGYDNIVRAVERAAAVMAAGEAGDA